MTAAKTNSLKYILFSGEVGWVSMCLSAWVHTLCSLELQQRHFFFYLAELVFRLLCPGTNNNNNNNKMMMMMMMMKKNKRQ